MIATSATAAAIAARRPAMHVLPITTKKRAPTGSSPALAVEPAKA